MKIVHAALLPLALAACAPPSVLPDQEVLGLGAVNNQSVQSRSALVALFPDFEARPVVQPSDWSDLNRTQAPEGALK